MTSERLARVALNKLVEPGDPRLLRMVADRGAEAVLEALRHEAMRHSSSGLAARLRTVHPERDLEDAGGRGLRFVIPGDPEWPEQLADLSTAGTLTERGGTPLGLWVRGRGDLGSLVRQAVAIVGSRSSTEAGTWAAADIAHQLSMAGWTVVSGAAFGIDQAAHRGALTAHRPTVGVLACGADRAYPTAHREMLEVIARDGVVVSEAPPGADVTKIRFLARNRLIAALATGTLVVEAALRSGALNTASWTTMLNRVLMGVPGPISSAPSEGVHQMIRNRGAVVVTRAAEVLEAVSPMGEHVLTERREPPRPHDALTVAEQQVLDAVPVVRAAGATSLARTSGLSAQQVSSALERLLSLRLVIREGEGYRLPPHIA